MNVLMRIVVAVAGALALGLLVSSSASAAGCHGEAATDLFLSHGISGVRVQREPCRRAVRSLRRWARDGRPGTGPAGWRCRSSRLNPDAKHVRCSRRAKRMRFDIESRSLR
jgi:hypothetical protein